MGKHSKFDVTDDMIDAFLNDRPPRPKPTEATHDQWTDSTGVKYWVHRWRMSCRDGCAIHAPSDHPMKDWPQYMRETMLIERICEHGVGHPDPDSLAWFIDNGHGYMGVHGCDLCCSYSKEK